MQTKTTAPEYALARRQAARTAVMRSASGGPIQYAADLSPGFTHYSTPGHGYYAATLYNAPRAVMQAAAEKCSYLTAHGWDTGANAVAGEEDCAVYVVLYLAHLYGEPPANSSISEALEGAERWFPGIIAAIGKAAA